jgi:hypothetical protein
MDRQGQDAGPEQQQGEPRKQSRPFKGSPERVKKRENFHRTMSYVL